LVKKKKKKEKKLGFVDVLISVGPPDLTRPHSHTRTPVGELLCREPPMPFQARLALLYPQCATVQTPFRQTVRI